MSTRAPRDFRAQAKVMKALAHPTRLFIVDELSRGQRCVRELTEMIGVEMPTVSRHLSLLKEAGLLADERRGANVFYRLKIPCCADFFQCVETVLADREAHRASEGKSCCGEGDGAV